MNVKPAQSKTQHEESVLSSIMQDLDLGLDEATETVEVDTNDGLINASADDVLTDLLSTLPDEPGEEVTETAQAAPEEKPADKPAKKTKAKAEKAPKEPKAPKAEKAAKEPKEPKEPRQYFANKIDRLKHRVETLEDVLKDNGVTEEEMRKIGVKVQNRMTFLIEFATGKSKALNGVMKAAIELLNKDGNLSTGEKGNLIPHLVSTGKTIGTAKSMSGNTVSAMRTLNMIKLESDGVFVANPDSPLLKRINGMI